MFQDKIKIYIKNPARSALSQASAANVPDVPAFFNK